MEFQYKKAMEDNGLSYKDLPEDAQTGIDQIKDVEKAFAMLEAKGKKPTAKTIRKMKALDKWVYYEILDFLQDTDENADTPDHDKEEILNDLDDDSKDGKGEDDNSTDNNDKDDNSTEMDENKKLGFTIEAELEKMFETGQKEWDIEDVSKVAKNTYNFLFESHASGEENGVKTNKYSLIEKGDVFVLSKN
jgi:hypothetical protein